MTHDEYRVEFDIQRSFDIKYTQGARLMLIEAEGLVVKKILISRSSMRNWQPPFHHEIISAWELEPIIERVRQTLEKRGFGLGLG